jgi:hypothetical protein
MDNNKNFTQSGESAIPQEIRNSSDFLPYIINTKTNKKFLESTFDQLVSSGTTEQINYYWGRVSGSTFVYNNDVYNYEPNSLRQNYQFSPGFTYQENDATQALSYVNIINHLKNNGYDINDVDRLYSNNGYTLDLPINSDAFINYINYFWIDLTIPVCLINATQQNQIYIEDIINSPNYTTPILKNNKSLKLLNGMRVSFTGNNINFGSNNISRDAVYIVGGVGNKIYLTEEIDKTGKNIRPGIVSYSLKNPTLYGSLGSTVFTYDDSIYTSGEKEYIVIDAASTNANPWSRVNKWLSKYAIFEICNYNEIPFNEIANINSRAKRPIIEFNADMELYNSGLYLRETVEHIIDCNNIINPTIDIEGKPEYIYSNSSFNDTDLVLFLNADNTYFNNKIFTIRYVGGEITLLPYITLFEPNEKILTKTSNVTEYIGAELYWNGSKFIFGQQKKSRGSSPLFNLYDEHGVNISPILYNQNGVNISAYQNSNFYGDAIFSYITSTTSVVDQELGIQAKTNSMTSTEFMFTFMNKTYGSTDEAMHYDNIEGLYYYKNKENDKLYTIWNPLKNTQRVPVFETKVSEQDNIEIQFDLGNSYSASLNYIVTNESDSYKWFVYDKTGISLIGDNSEHVIFQKNKQYTITPLLKAENILQFVNQYGETDNDITYSYQTDGKIKLKIESTYSYNSIGYKNATNNINGKIYLTNSDNTITCYKNGTRFTQYNIESNILKISSDVKKGDVFELSYISDNVNKSHDVAPIFSNNPFNKDIDNISYSDILMHLQNQMITNPAFSGSVTNENNYHYIPKINTYGGIIRQQSHSPVIHSVLTSRETSEPTAAMHSVAIDYANFTLYFKNKVKQLWNTRSWDNVRDLVNTALTEINIGKSSEFKYANSDMAYYENGKTISYQIKNNTNTFSLLSEIHSFGYNKIPTYIWISENSGTGYKTKILKHNTDYTFSGKSVVLSYEPVYSVQNPATLTITQYIEPSYSFIPFSSVKLGLEKPYDVKISNGKLELHDGSFYNLTSSDILDMNSVNFDVVGAALYDLELRILNNLPEQHNNIENVTQFMPKFKIYGSTIEWEEFRNNIIKEFYYWKNSFDYGNKTIIPCDPTNEFSWNYTTVGFGIPSWRGIYLYNFGTIRPNTHPWEMLGHNTKPLWWDTHYSWTNSTKRQKLINSLKLGITENPSLTTSYPNPNYSLMHYDWDNKTLVTTSGVLNGPVSAELVIAPSSINYVKSFEYGDMMYNDELNWMQSSEYTYSLIISLMRFMPTKIFETYSAINSIEKKQNLLYNAIQLVYSDTGTRTTPILRKIHNETILNSGIRSINIKNQGSNYSNQTTVTAKISSTGDVAKFLPTITNGKITAVTITESGIGYKNDIELIVTDPTSNGSGASIIGNISSTNISYINPGIMAAIVEYNNNIYNPSELKKIIESIKFSPIVHIGGYTRKQNIDIKLDGSYLKGNVSIPKEDFEVILTKNPTIKSIFYSGVRIEKTRSNSYRVWGFDILNPNFEIYPPNVNASVVAEKINNYSIKRYLKFKNNSIKIPYGTEFIKRQDLYNFMIGLGEFYKVNGFEVNWYDAANDAISWSIDETIVDDFYQNGIGNSIVYNQGSHGIVDPFISEKISFPKLVDKNGKSVASKNILIIRNQTDTEISKKNQNFDLYGISVTVSEYEHVLALSPISQFGDVIYNDALGIGQKRIKIYGERTRNWNGRIEANGYIVTSNSIFGNFETSVREMENDYVNAQGRPLDLNISKTSRFNVGYLEPSYLNLTTSDNNTLYQFSIGERKSKGTLDAINAFTRNKELFQGNTVDYEVSENWMVRLGDYGDKRKSNPIQVELDKSRIKTNPQAVRLNKVPVFDKLDDIVIDISEKDTKYIGGDFSKPISIMPMKNQNLQNNNIYTKTELANIFENYLTTAGLPLITESTHAFKSIDDMNLAFDSLADYANIENWSSTKVYRQGDKVRLNGKVYQLIIDSTKLNYSGGILYARGNVTFPTASSGQTFIIGTNSNDMKTVTFEKITSQTIYDPIKINGTITNATTLANKTLMLDGKTIILQKTDNTTVYQPIEYIGTVSSPTFDGTSGKSLIIDGITINLEKTITTNEQTTALSALNTAIEDVKISTAIALVISSNRIQAFRNLRSEYPTYADWTTFIDNYFSGIYDTYGLNIPYLNTQISNSTIESKTEKLNVLRNSDIELINAIKNTTYSNTDLPTLSARSESIDAITNSSVASRIFSSFYAEIKSSRAISSETILIIDVLTYPIKWNVDLLVDKINSIFLSSGKPRLIASKTLLNNLKITKTAIAQDNTLVISSATANNDVGFIASTTSSNISVPNSSIITLSEIVNLINLAKITNVRASITSANGNSVLTITSSNPTLVIGTASANTDIGIIANQYVAQTTQSNTESELQIYDIITQINNESIPNITAKNVNNFLVIESSGNSLIIGNGTANIKLGISQVEQNVREYVDNLFVESNWQQITDPTDFKIWVQDNIGYLLNSNTTLSGYNMYQSFDFDINIIDICPGVEADDNAMITVGNDLNVSVGDYVVVLNTNSIPNINGIHKVLGKTKSNSFLIDAYIDTNGSNGKILLLKPTRFSSSQDLFDTITNELYSSNGGGWKDGMLAYVDYVNYPTEDLDMDGYSRGAVYKCVSDYTSNNIYFEIERYQNRKTNNKEIKNAIIYNDFVNSLSYLEIFDPAKGLIPGVAENEIDFKSPYDVAIYNNSTDIDASLDNSNYWGEEQVGKVWWDLDNAIYLDYEQSTLEYRQSNWGKLYPTGSIDVYEWVRSSYLPEEYNQYSNANIKVDGVVLSGQSRYELTSYGDTVYSWTEETTFDPIIGAEKTYYYYWVKNKISLPNNKRKYSVTQLRQIIEDPTTVGIHWVAFSDYNILLLGNISSCVSCAGSVLQVNYANENTAYHQEYTLLAENSNDTFIPEWLHIGLRDSVAGEDKSIYDFNYTNWSSNIVYLTGNVVAYNDLYYICLQTNSSKNPKQNITYWKKLYSAKEIFDDKTQTNVIRVSAPRQVPDIWLHRFSRYGNLVTPRQSWIMNQIEARRVFISKINKLVSKINVVSEITAWDKVLNSNITVDNTVYNMNDYWKFIDWKDELFDSSKKIDKIVNYKDDLYDIVNPIQGYSVKVNFANIYDGIYNYSIYKYDFGIWKIVYKERGTFQFIDELWNSYLTGAGWDTASWDRTGWDNVPAIVLQSIFDTLKNDIFVENYEAMYADLWFTMVKYIISEQNSIDWIIKSTLTDVTVKYAMKETKSYIPDMVDSLIDYFNDIKPFHTKLRNFTAKRSISDDFIVSVQDHGKKASMTLQYNQHTEKNFTELNLNGGNNWNSSNDIDYSNFNTTTYDYIYDGNKFIQPKEEGWASELFPMRMTDAVRILITRNTNGSVENSNSVYPIIFSDKDDKLEYSKSTANTITTLSNAVLSTDTIIQVTDITKLWNPAISGVASVRGIIWINGERITYRNIEGNKLLNCIRGTKGTVARGYALNDLVYSANSEYVTITPPEFELKVHDWDTDLWDATLWDNPPVLIVKI